MRERLSVWLVRALAGSVLLLFAEIGWWTNDPASYTPGDWLASALIHVALGALLLDLIARFRVTDGLGLLLVGGIYALVGSALLSPAAFADLRNLFSRALGVQALGVAVPGLLLTWWLLDGRRPAIWRLAALAVLGFAWGVWLPAYPLLPLNGFPGPTLPQALATLAGGLIGVGVLAQIARAAKIEDPSAYCLRAWEWIVVGGVLLALFLLRGYEHIPPGPPLPLAGAVVGYLIGALYIQRAPEPGDSLLRTITPPKAAPLPVFAAYALALIVPVIPGYLLAGQGPDTPLFAGLVNLFFVLGFGWLPGASLALGVRAYLRLERERQR